MVPEYAPQVVVSNTNSSLKSPRSGPRRSGEVRGCGRQGRFNGLVTSSPHQLNSITFPHHVRGCIDVAALRQEDGHYFS